MIPTPFGQRLRLCSAVLIVLAAFSALGNRLVDLHLGDHRDVLEKQQRARVYRKEIRAPRGRILDRNGQVLAIDRAVHDLAVDTAFVVEHGDPDRTANLVGALAGLDVAALRGTILSVGRSSRFVPVRKFLPEETVTAIQEARANKAHRQTLKGIRVDTRSSRSYPLGSVMSHIVGYASSLGNPASGVELRLNDMLRGKDGLQVSEKDGSKQELYNRRSIDVPAEPGFDVQLTLDRYLQYKTEQSLDRAMIAYQPDAAWAILMDTRTGAILAMASKPDFNPNQGYDAGQPGRVNHALASVYEPGSVLKALVVGAVFNEKLAHPAEMIDCTGPWFFAGKFLRDAHPYGALSVMDVLKKSSNIGSAKLALRLGDERLERYYRDFGLGRKTGVELPGEQNGLFHPRDRKCATCGIDANGKNRCPGWSGLTISRISIGQGIATTALQVLNAVNTIANDGLRMQPTIIRRVTDSRGRPVHEFEPKVVKRVLDIDAARLTRRLMARVTEAGGTGRRAALDYCQVAAKTGTAQKAGPGGYSNTDYVASFVGFFPAEEPVVSLIVTLDNPKPEHQGGRVAAPVFKEIAEEAIRYLNIPTNAVPVQVQI